VPRKFYATRGKVNISTHLTQDIGADGKQLRVTEFRDYTGEVVRSLFTDVAQFRHGWADPERRSEVLAALNEKSIDATQAAALFGNPEVDPFDILCNVAWNAPVLTRKERVARARSAKPDFFDAYGGEAREILDVLLTKYADHGPVEFAIPESLKVPPISNLGNVSEIIQHFGGAEQFRNALTKLQELLYAA
jgi:type I restriction enzyme R subunit